MDLKLCVSSAHGIAMLWAVAIICGEVPSMENGQLMKKMCALDTSLDSHL